MGKSTQESLNLLVGCADCPLVTNASTITVTELDDVLWQLPTTFAIAQQGHARMVVGPAGCTVLLAESSSEHAEHDADALAQGTRMALADHLEWVPFVDALVVTADAETGSVVSAEYSTLFGLLAEGPAMLEEPTVQRLVALLLERRLEPAWEVIRPLTDATSTLD